MGLRCPLLPGDPNLRPNLRPNHSDGNPSESGHRYSAALDVHATGWLAPSSCPEAPACREGQDVGSEMAGVRPVPLAVSPGDTSGGTSIASAWSEDHMWRHPSSNGSAVKRLEGLPITAFAGPLAAMGESYGSSTVEQKVQDDNVAFQSRGRSYDCSPYQTIVERRSTRFRFPTATRHSPNKHHDITTLWYQCRALETCVSSETVIGRVSRMVDLSTVSHQ